MRKSKYGQTTISLVDEIADILSDTMPENTSQEVIYRAKSKIIDAIQEHLNEVTK